MRRREFLLGVAGSSALASAGTVRGHPGPYRYLGRVPITNAREAVPGPNGDYTYVAATSGFAVVDTKLPREPKLVVERRNLLSDRETGPLRDVQDVKVEGDRLVVAGPADPYRNDVLQGFLLYDVSNPEEPQRLAFFETDYPIHNCFIRDGHVYLTGNNRGRNPLVVVDVSGDEPTEVARWSLLDRDDRWRNVSPGLRTIHDVWVGRDGRAYLAHWDAGTWILDVSDPTSPQYVAQIGGRPLSKLASIPQENTRNRVLRLPGNAHYTMPNDDGTLLGVNKEAWQVGGKGRPGGVELWDISDPKDAQKLSTIQAPPSPDPSIGGTWTTSHNFDIVGDRLFTSWYEGGVKIHDVSDPANPEQLAWWRDPENAVFWTSKLAAEKFFVASSMGRPNDEKGALYTFGNHPGQQKDAPLLTQTGNATKATEVSRATTENEATSNETTTQSSGSSGGAPGFGISATVAALLGGAAWRELRK
ncbi:LVIVD repeat-containing protein [Halorussus halophilus]|uniref:LVIVD repeat-containing protein n=1 Tax=Halorussus halophilus TaxID=2650975 RepID=UPI0013018351|nr:hypothetical protein [Halorussus halophilus]